MAAPEHLSCGYSGTPDGHPELCLYHLGDKVSGFDEMNTMNFDTTLLNKFDIISRKQ